MRVCLSFITLLLHYSGRTITPASHETPSSDGKAFVKETDTVVNMTLLSILAFAGYVQNTVDFDSLEKQFKAFESRIFESTKRVYYVKTFRHYLSDLSFKNEIQCEIFKSILFQMIENESEFEEIWHTISLHWNFLNHSLLEKFVDMFGDEDLRSDFSDFMVNLKEFKHKTYIKDPALNCYLENSAEQYLMVNFKTISMKIRRSWQLFTLEDIEVIKEGFEDKFSFPSFFLNLLCVSHGSINITWTIPAEITVILKEKFKQPDIVEFCIRQGILSMIVDGYEYDFLIDQAKIKFDSLKSGIVIDPLRKSMFE